MTLTMEKTAWTSILALARDYSCAIYDSQARQVCMMDAIPVHCNSMHVVLEEIARTFEGDIHDGDVIVCNDPYSGNKTSLHAHHSTFLVCNLPAT